MSKLVPPFKVMGGAILLLSFFIFRANSATILEGFESGDRENYAPAEVKISTGIWNLNNAVISNSRSPSTSLPSNTTRISHSFLPCTKVLVLMKNLVNRAVLNPKCLQ
ncbi:hypothetical protein [Scytonema hofmannii]|nr:hypothetical protein [Scytonema hofmannii]